MTPRRLFVSFSGGETSAYMLWYILTHMKDEYDELVVVFANTGCEESCDVYADEDMEMA